MAKVIRVLVVVAVGAVALAVVGVLASKVFFAFSTTWIVPAEIASTDDRVAGLRDELAAHRRERERLAGALVEAERPVAALEASARSRREAAKRELERAIARRDSLKLSVARVDASIAEVEASPYLRAASGNALIAMAPYRNLEDVGIGTGVYACRLRMLWCRRVGEVVDVLAGEVSFQHPHRERQLRGRMLELRLDDRDAAQADVLFVGGAPLWL